MSTRKSNRKNVNQSTGPDQSTEIESVVETATTDPVVVVDPNEEKIDELESLIVRLTDDLNEAKSQLRKLTKKSNSDGPSKMDQCKLLMESNPGLQRKDFIKMFMDKVGMTKSGASTYFQLIKPKK